MAEIGFVKFFLNHLDFPHFAHMILALNTGCVYQTLRSLALCHSCSPPCVCHPRPCARTCTRGPVSAAQRVARVGVLPAVPFMRTAHACASHWTGRPSRLLLDVSAGALRGATPRRPRGQIPLLQQLQPRTVTLSWVWTCFFQLLAQTPSCK